MTDRALTPESKMLLLDVWDYLPVQLSGELRRRLAAIEAAAEARALPTVEALSDHIRLALTSPSGAPICACPKGGIPGRQCWYCEARTILSATPAPPLPTVEALARQFIRIRGAHKGDYETGEALGIPCEWCVMAAEQAHEALSALAATPAPAPYCCEHAGDAHEPDGGACLIDGCRCARRAATPAPAPEADRE